MRVIVDKIEENIIEVELPDGNMVNLPKEILEDVKEGDIVEINILKNETKERKEKIEDLANKLFED